MFRRRLLAVAAVTGLIAVVPTSAARAANATPWLDQLNAYRAGSGLAAVTNQPAWNSGLAHHLTYLSQSPPGTFTGPYQDDHTENPESAYYTPDGTHEGAASVLAQGDVGFAPADYIDLWMGAPFHAIGMLAPNLRSVAFVSDPQSGDAGLDVKTGVDTTAPPSSVPILYPGPNTTTTFSTFGGERPDPRDTCGWTGDVGLPIIALLPNTPDPHLTAALTTPFGAVRDVPNGGLCLVDSTTYKSADSVYGPSGSAVLGQHNAVVLVPRDVLSSGTYGVKISQPGRPDITWSFTVSTGGTAPSPKIPVYRIAGADRIETATLISRVGYTQAQSAKAVVLADAYSFADALAGGPLAAAVTAPMLLTHPGALDAVTESEIQRVLPPGGTVYVLGGPLAIAPAIEATLQGLGYRTTRIAGADRYDTADRIAAFLGPPSAVFEATGLDFPDALAAAPAAAKVRGVVVLTNGPQQHYRTAAYLATVPSSVPRYAVGGDAAAADPSAQPLAGADRYQTAVLVDKQFFPAPKYVGVASGNSFADADTASPALGIIQMPLVITPSAGVLPGPVSSYLTSIAAGTSAGVAFGGPYVLSDGILQQVAATG
jgi:putative cell wall-binding protein